MEREDEPIESELEGDKKPLIETEVLLKNWKLGCDSHVLINLVSCTSPSLSL